ncbi:unnamed protein product [Orchesella dallaii]|uniref:Protein msta n=1 Tax=Orchesella dallaii TaxID=48710 RepID=A0ABP1RDY1_9HEXA
MLAQIYSLKIDTKIVIQERPLACSPADDPNYDDLGEIPMCLGCCARMSGNPKAKCLKCEWPICSAECEQIEHHAGNECSIFEQSQVRFTDLPAKSLIDETIFILRLCLLKSKKPSVWNDILMKFEDHNSVRQTKKICVEKDRKVLENLKAIYDKVDDEPPFETEDVIKISGIINVNAFSSTKLEDECSSRRMKRRVTITQCVFPTASLLAHCCVPNACWTVSGSPNFEMTIRTTVKIPKGEMIAIAYAPREVFVATLQRLVSTEDIAHFICHCHRCLDATELNTFLGAIKCSRCKHCALLEDSESDKGYLLPKNPINPESEWQCLRCENVIPVQKVVKRLVKIEKDFESIKAMGLSRDEEADEMEYLYKRSLDEHLHRNHYLLQEISLRIVNRQASCIYNLDAEEIERFVYHCKSILKVSDVLCPGFCRHRALIQFYMSQVMMIEVRKRPIAALNNEEVFKIFQPIYKLQKEAFTYFRSEDENDNRNRPTYLKGCNQYVACLMEEMKETMQHI